MTEEYCFGVSNDIEARKQACRQWFAKQPVYREKIRELFTRMWRIAPEAVEEVYATKTYASLTDAQRSTLKPLQPSGKPTVKLAFDAPKETFTFEILVPWEVFPPATRLHLERIKVALNILEGKQIVASTQADSRAMLEEPELRSFPLSPEIAAHFTPCEYPLAGRDGEPAFYCMNHSLNVREAFVFQNERVSGWIHPPAPDDVAPGVKSLEYFVQRLAPGEFLCSSPLSYRKGNTIKRFPFEIGPGPSFSSVARCRLPFR